MTETNNLITHFEVSNFKKFDHLVVEDIGQFNLITGDNNVGKTCLLEALMVVKNASRTFFILGVLRDKRRFNDVFITRGLYDSEEGKDITFKENFFAKYQANYFIPTEFVFNNDRIKISNIQSKILDTSIDTRGIYASDEIEKFIKQTNFFGNPSINQNSENWLLFYLNNELVNIRDLSPYSIDQQEDIERSLPIILLGDDIEEEYFWTFGKIFTESTEKKKEILDKMSSIFQGIHVIDIVNEIPKYKSIKNSIVGFNHKHDVNFLIATDKNREYHSLRNYGDGFIRVFHILSLIYSGFDRIYIDEIDTGIHFSKMKDFWRKILNLCKDLNVQLFATTHSQECIEAYAQALEELGMEDNGRIIMLQEEHKSVKSYTFKSLDEHLDYRG